MAKRLDASVEAAIVEAYHNGEGGVTMARRLGIGTTSVYRALKRHGIERNPPSARPKRFSSEEEATIAKQYEEQASSAKVAAEYGCSSLLVRTIARRHGVSVGARGGRVKQWDADERAEIVRRYEDGESQEDIAADCGIGQVTISRILRAEGVATGNVGERHGNWKGGRTERADGYTLVRLAPDDLYAPMRTPQGYVLEHRLVMAQKLGRCLKRHETVHHINGDRKDNRPENLELRQGKHGHGVVLVCGDCGSHNIVHSGLAKN